MNRRENWMDRLASTLDLQQETILRQPLVELTGERRVLIENHRGVTSYGTGQICVKVSFGSVEIQGCGLELCKMTRQQLIICGRIDSVTLIRRKC